MNDHVLTLFVIVMIPCSILKKAECQYFYIEYLVFMPSIKYTNFHPLPLKMTDYYLLIVSQLNSELSKGKKEREAVEKKLSSLQESHAHLQTQFDQLVEQSAQQVSITDHQSALKEMHGSVEFLYIHIIIIIPFIYAVK